MIEENNDELELLRLRLEQLENEKLEILENRQNSVGYQLKQSINRMALNTVQDLPTTLPGVAVGLTIVGASWPNVDTNTLLEALGFGVMGGISNSRGGKRDLDEFKDINKGNFG